MPTTPESRDGRVGEYLGGASLQEVAERRGVSPQAIHQSLVRAGIPRRPRAMSEEQKMEWCQLAQELYIDVIMEGR